MVKPTTQKGDFLQKNGVQIDSPVRMCKTRCILHVAAFILYRVPITIAPLTLTLLDFSVIGLLD